MRIDIDLDLNNRIISSPGLKDALSRLEFKRDTASPLEVRFWQAGAIVELAADAAGKFGIKPAEQYDAAPLVLAESWTKTGTGAETVYTFEPEFNGAALATLLGSGDGNTANDEDYVLCMTEILWIIDSKKTRTQSVQTLIYNDVLKDADGTPSASPSPLAWFHDHDEPARLLKQAVQQLNFSPSAAGVINFVTKRVSALGFSSITASTAHWRFRLPSGSLHTLDTTAPAETTTSGNRPLSLISVDAGGSPSGSFTFLNCIDHHLTALDVSGCDDLTQLFCEANQLSILYLTNCPALMGLTCHRNQLTTLDLSGCPALTELYCQKNQLAALDLTACPINYLNASQNPDLTTLDLSGKADLLEVTCTDCQLTSLVVTGCVNLIEIHAENNQLTAAAVDAILIDIADAALANAGIIDLAGTGNAAPTAASADALAALLGESWDVTTN